VTQPFDPGYFISPELRQMGFARVGENVAISRNCTIVGLSNITIGDNVRIDGFTSIIAPTGPVRIGSHVQIGIGCVLGARGGIVLDDYSSLSHGVRILTAVDDFAGRHMTNSTLPVEVLGVQIAPVRIGCYVPIGAGTMILPGVEIDEGTAVGAMSLVRMSLPGWRIYSGDPLQDVGERSRDLLSLAERLRAQQHHPLA
jgi:galactoside O-acetyltransferase